MFPDCTDVKFTPSQSYLWEKLVRYASPRLFAESDLPRDPAHFGASRMGVHVGEPVQQPIIREA